MEEKHVVYLGLGANLGNRRETLLRAYNEIEKLIGPITRQSAFFVSRPWGFRSKNLFLNSVICCETELLPREVLNVTQTIERNLGRTRKTTDGTYHDRLIDIDILLYDKQQIIAPDLRIPHPLMHQRTFVMLPLLEILKFDLSFLPPLTRDMPSIGQQRNHNPKSDKYDTTDLY